MQALKMAALMKSRPVWMAGVGAVLILAAWALQGPASNWAADHFWTEKVEHPSSPLEAEWIDGWSDLDTRAPVHMFSVPFSIRCSEPEPEVQCFVMENTSHYVMRNFHVYRSDMPNFYSAQTLVATATAGKRTQTEKVVALWKLFTEYYYNYYPLPYKGMLLDPVTLFAVFGTAQCSEAAPVLQTLCEIAGCRTRPVTLDWEEGGYRIAHCAMEVRADGRWIYMDPDGHSIYRLPNGRLASARDLIRNADPVRHSTHAYYNSAVLADAFEKGKVTFYPETDNSFRLARRQTDPRSYSLFHHFIRWDMLPGTKVTTFPEQGTRFFYAPLPEFANALLEWSYRPEDFATGDYRGLLEENLEATVRGNLIDLRPINPDEPAALVIPMISPYLMVGGQVVSDIVSAGTVRLYVLPFPEGVADAEDNWQPIAALNEEHLLSLDEVLQDTPVFGYALRIEVPPCGATVRHLEVQTWLQCALKALPYLSHGENEFVLYSQMPASVAASSHDETGETVVFDNGLKLTFAPGKAGPARAVPAP
jgi:hypothetical protein